MRGSWATSPSLRRACSSRWAVLMDSSVRAATSVTPRSSSAAARQRSTASARSTDWEPVRPPPERGHDRRSFPRCRRASRHVESRLCRSDLEGIGALAAAVVGLVLVAAACGGDDDDADGTTAAAASEAPRHGPGRHGGGDTAGRRTRPATTAPSTPTPTARHRPTTRPRRRRTTPSSGEPVTLRLGYFPNVTHAPAIIGVEDGLFQDALGDERDARPVDVQLRHRGHRGAVLRRHRRLVHRAQPGHQRLRPVRRRGPAHRRRHHVGRRLPRRPRGHRRPVRARRARRWPRRRSATPRTSPCGRGSRTRASRPTPAAAATCRSPRRRTPTR